MTGHGFSPNFNVSFEWFNKFYKKSILFHKQRYWQFFYGYRKLYQMDRSILNLSSITEWLKLDVVPSIILYTGSMLRRDALLKRSKHSGQKCSVEIDSCIFECLRSLMKLEHLSLLGIMVSINSRITIQSCYFTVLKIVIPVI